MATPTAAAGIAFDVQLFPGMLAPYGEQVATAKRRQAAVWRGEKPDAWPIILHGGTLTPEQEAIPVANLEEAFYDPERMLCTQTKQSLCMLQGGSDGVPSIRGNFGAATLLACAGLEQLVFPDKMPWLQEHLSKEQVVGMTPDDFQIQGTFERGLEFMRYARAILGDSLAIYCMDMQGPLDLAHLLVGDALFYEMYDAPQFVHHVLELCLELSIRAHTWMKEISGEPLTQNFHSNALYAENVGLRICEDTTAILSPAGIAEFAMPYTRRLAQHFGGAWVHYCGRSDALSEAASAMPEIRGINFGHVPGHEHDHPFEADMQRCVDTGTVYFGSWPRRPGEDGADYLRRLHTWASQGVMIPHADAAVGSDNGGFTSPREALEFWYGL